MTSVCLCGSSIDSKGIYKYVIETGEFSSLISYGYYDVFYVTGNICLIAGSDSPSSGDTGKGVYVYDETTNTLTQCITKGF
jgi:hypothetical protein